MDIWNWIVNHAIQFLTLTVCGLVYGYVRGIIKQYKAHSASLVTLLRGQIINTYNHYLPHESMPIYAKETFASLYDQYKVLGGNGAVDSIYKQAMDWPTKI